MGGTCSQNRLEKAAARYLELERERRRLAMAGRFPASGNEDLDDGQGDLLCRARAEALTAAKAEFGEELFLRLLYQGVAPTARISYVPAEEDAERLLFVERGCPRRSVP